MTAYCTGSDIFTLMSANGGLRPSEGSSDLSSDALSGKAADHAVDITGAINNRVYGPTKEAAIEDIIAGLDPAQALILALTNTLRAGPELFQERATEIDYKYDKVSKDHNAFLSLPFEKLNNGKLRSAFNSDDARYPIATYRPQTKATTFAGTGTNTLTSSGHYTGTITTILNLAIFEIELIDSTHFHWRFNGGTYSISIAITGSAQVLADGISIAIPAGSHIAADKWTITFTLYATIYTVARFAAPYDPRNATPVIANSIVNLWLNWWTPTIYALAPSTTYDPATLAVTGARKFAQIINQCVAGMILQAVGFCDAKGNVIDTALTRFDQAIKLIDLLMAGVYRLSFV